MWFLESGSMAEIFPPGFPGELAANAFTAGSEAAWPIESAWKVVQWLGQNGFAVLGTELWVVREDGIQPGIYVNGTREIHGNAISHKRNESWNAYVVRSAEETLSYLHCFKAPREAQQQGKVLFNIPWASESGYLT